MLVGVFLPRASQPLQPRAAEPELGDIEIGVLAGQDQARLEPA
jgi:hypothetical protein